MLYLFADLKLPLDTNLFFLDHSDEEDAVLSPHLTSKAQPTPHNLSPPESPEISPPGATPSSPLQPASTDTGVLGPQPNLNPICSLPLYEKAPRSSLTTNDCLVSILTFSQRNNLSGACTSELIDLLSSVLPQPNNLPKTSYLFKQYFKDEKSALQIFYFCSHCWSSRASLDTIPSVLLVIVKFLIL